MGTSNSQSVLNPPTVICSQKRLVFFVQDGTGLGHLRRLCRIAKHLQGKFACLIISGHRAASWIVPEECEYVHLPSWDSLMKSKAEYWDRKPFVKMARPERLDFRNEIIKGAIRGFKPDAIFVDHLPLGKYDELEDLIVHGTFKKYYVTRGIYGANDEYLSVILDGKPRDYLEKYFDRMFIACDQNICDFSLKYPVSTALQEKLIHTGYVADAISPESIKQARSERGIQNGDIWVICSAGGGKLGEKLITVCMQFAKKFPNVHFDIIQGPRSGIVWSQSNSNTIIDDNVRLHRESRYLYQLHASADIVITTGGYNSIVEALQGNAFIICCPARLEEDDEQFLHACYLSNLVNIVVSTDLTKIQKLLQDVLSKRSTLQADQRHKINFSGASTIESIVCNDLF